MPPSSQIYGIDLVVNSTGTFNAAHSPFLLAVQQAQEDQAFLCPPAR